MKNIIVALDGISSKEALRIARMMHGRVWGFKVSDLLFEDSAIIGRLKKFGRVFADAKLYDIPNTVTNTVARLSKKGASFITVHASGGTEMMKAAVCAAGRSKILAVTVLTSKSDPTAVVQLARAAAKAGVSGIVCSGHELEAVRRVPELRPLLKVVPGIRPRWYRIKHDQKRTMTPAHALERGADYLVVGRPLLRAADPVKALDRLIEEMRHPV